MSLMTWMFPPSCVLCRCALTEDTPDGLCDDCRALMKAERERRLYRVLPNLWVIAAAAYGGTVRSAVIRVKKHAIRAAAPCFGELVYQAYLTQKTERTPDLVTFVPSSSVRNRERGFTLTEEMAERVADRLNLPMRPTLRHKSLSSKQAYQRGSKREKHAEDNIFLKSGIDLTGQTVLLIDDIVASGSTINHSAGLLLQAGASEVVGLVLAKS